MSRSAGFCAELTYLKSKFMSCFFCSSVNECKISLSLFLAKTFLALVVPESSQERTTCESTAKVTEVKCTFLYALINVGRHLTARYTANNSRVGRVRSLEGETLDFANNNFEVPS